MDQPKSSWVETTIKDAKRIVWIFYDTFVSNFLSFVTFSSYKIKLNNKIL